MRWLDEFQQRHAWLGFPFAVFQKYSDDQGGYLAATIAYYGFFSLFPLLLVATTILGYVLHGDQHAQERIVGSALAQFPVIGRELKTHALQGNALALAIGIIAALWAGMGVFLASENALNSIWGVPFKRRPDAIRARGRALGLLLLLGGGALGATILSGLGTFGARYGLAWKIGSIALSTAFDFGLFLLAFRVMTARGFAWSDLWLGAAAAAVLYEILQSVGGWYVGHELRHAKEVYGTFALVIGLLAWIYLAAHITLLAAELNVVARRRLWPRSFSVVVERPATAADERALTQRAELEERRQDERVEVEFDQPS
jgi:YihY family inner membrane protein